ncbi:hypothetical protein M3A74_04375 [Corynebacterium appendicis]|uniref:hypothetical protein n=1 Tax=Corynebacterium appendicis TaxID=163202 RepID=UPI00223AFF97|nr:hypothetical protein [Corynebacterium appendicis]MCT1684052.1 hypothetical protein [Corynebacterium appendicis]
MTRAQRAERAKRREKVAAAEANEAATAATADAAADPAQPAATKARTKLPRFTPRKSKARPDDLVAHEDAWLDQLEETPRRKGLHGIRTRLGEYMGGTGRWVGDAWGFVSSTVGKLLLMLLMVTLFMVAGAWAASQASANRESGLQTLLNATEPMSNSAHTLFTSMSRADTLATTSFVQPGLQTAESHQEYLDAIDSAVVAADEVLRGSVVTRADDTDTVQDLVREIQRLIPQYTGLMERAQANQRVGNPLGVAYMTQASSLMHETMLLKAQVILDTTREQVEDEMNRLTRAQLVPLSGLLAALLVLGGAQYALWRMFRRRLNKGFLAATALTLVAMVWLGASNIAAWDAGRHEFAGTAGPYEQLTNARTQAQEMRTAETITLLTRNTQRTTMSMNDTSAEVANALDAVSAVTNADEIITARNALADWRLTHTSMMNALNSGDYDRAVELSADSEEPTTATAFSLLDDSLGELIGTARYAQRAHINDALGTTRGMSTGLLVLMLAAIVCAFIGARPRIQEYV